MPTQEQLLAALQAVVDPNTGKDFVATKALKNLSVKTARCSSTWNWATPPRARFRICAGR